MGCDIHGCLEKKINNKWIMIRQYGFSKYIHFRERNYKRFAELACVRGEGGLTASGIPDDVSAGTQYWIDDYGCDGHNHSYLPIKKLVEIFSKTEWVADKYVRDYPFSYFLGIDGDDERKIDDIGNFRVVFWFDN